MDVPTAKHSPITASLSAAEELDVLKKVQFELANFQHKVVNIGGILNPLAGLFIIMTLWNKADPTILVAWYIALFSVNLINVCIAYRNRNITPDQPIQWRRALTAYHVMIAILTLVYGCLGVLYTSEDPYYQLFVITFLELLIVGFNLGTITDIVACTISNFGLLIPYLSWSIYLLFFSSSESHVIRLNFSYGITLLILALFFYMSTYVGYILVRKFFRLSFEKIILSEKLENANKFLEERVAIRTMELQDSLKLVKHQATHDLLTSLPNQHLLSETLQSTIELAYKKKKKFAVICIHINEIEKINDAFGYRAGDFVIKIIAQRYQRFIEKMNNNDKDNLPYFIALTRKDVLVMIMPIQSEEENEHKIANIFSILNEPIVAEKNTLKFTASLGYSFFPKDGTDTKMLLMHADAAMSQAKQEGGNNFKFYKTDIHANIHKKLQIEGKLHNALKNNEFKLKYQPVIDLNTGRVYGAESLLRWENPIIGSVSPAEFIPIAEANGIIIPLGEWVFRSVCSQIRTWHEQHNLSIVISINLSAKQLNKNNLIDVISRALEENHLRPDLIIIELTETAAFHEENISIIKKFKELGLSLAIDDFGTGYSGLSNLKLFSIDKLKIDKSFIQDLGSNNDSRAIVSKTIALAHEMNVDVIAEGVETEEQLCFLQEYGCHLIQGYYFSMPLDENELTKLVLEKNS